MTYDEMPDNASYKEQMLRSAEKYQERVSSTLDAIFGLTTSKAQLDIVKDQIVMYGTELAFDFAHIASNEIERMLIDKGVIKESEHG